MQHFVNEATVEQLNQIKSDKVRDIVIKQLHLIAEGQRDFRF